MRSKRPKIDSHNQVSDGFLFKMYFYKQRRKGIFCCFCCLVCCHKQPAHMPIQRGGLQVQQEEERAPSSLSFEPTRPPGCAASGPAHAQTRFPSGSRCARREKRRSGCLRDGALHSVRCSKLGFQTYASTHLNCLVQLFGFFFFSTWRK